MQQLLIAEMVKNKQRDRREYFANCMELNGFESKWVVFEVATD